jgi:CRP/FNR family transcriptional regulator, cyclic AMP receptor protein
MSPAKADTASKRIQPHEKMPVFLLALLFFLFKTGLEIAGNLAEVIYFRRMGVTSLPRLYAIEPLAMVFVLAFFGLLINRINFQRLLLGLNLAFVFFLLVVRFLILAEWQQIYFGFYILQRIFLALLPLTFWLVCSDLFDIRQAKRLFVLITASGLAGALVGDVLTGLLSGSMAPEGILFLTSLFFLASAGMGIWLARLDLPKSYIKPKVSTTESFSPVFPFDLLKQSFMRIFTVLILITGMLEPVWRYELNAIANQSFSAESSLIAFYGYFKAAAVLVVVVFQLFLAARLMEKMGIPWSLSTHPLGLAGIMLLLGFYPTLWVAIACVALIGIVRIGFDESGRKVIIGIYPPYERTRVSSFERQMTYLGIFLGGLFLIWAVGHLSMAQINWIAAAFAALWVLFFSRFRAQYAKACLGRGRSPLDKAELPVGVEKEPGSQHTALLLDSLLQSSPGAAFQGAALRESKFEAALLRSIDQAGEQGMSAIQSALRSPILGVRQFARRASQSGPGGIDAQVAAQLDFAERLQAWQGIPEIHKLVTEKRNAAARACLTLLEGRYPGGEMRVASRMLHSRAPDVHANGLEALDITLRGAQKKRLFALFESAFSFGEVQPINELAADMVQIGLAMIQVGDPELAFWGNIYRLRSGEVHYLPPVPDGMIPLTEMNVLLAAVRFPQNGDDAMQLADKIDAIRASEAFASLSETELRVLAMCSREAAYAVDEVIFEEGQAGNALYILLDGQVELASLAEKKSLQALSAGSIFGEHALFTEEPYSLTAVTVSRVHLLILEREVFLELVQYYPNIAISLLRNLAGRFEKATRLLQMVWI